MKTSPLRFALLAAAAMFAHAVFAGKPTPPPPPAPSSGTVVLDYSGMEGTGAENFSLIVAPSGTVYASGVSYDSPWRGIVLASSTSGNSWSSVDAFPAPGRDLQTDGKVLISGNFRMVDGVSRYKVARLNPDGRLDPSFNSGSGIDNQVGAIAAQSDGKVLIGCVFFDEFDGVQGVIRSRIARLDASGSVDVSFDSGLFQPSLGNPLEADRHYVPAIVVQPDDKIVVGSTSFFQNPGSPTCDLVRLNADGSLDADFDPVHGARPPGYGAICVALQSDDKVVIGGDFTSLNGVGINRIARVNDDGSLDFGFYADIYDRNPGWGSVRAIAVQPDGKMLVGGSFTTVNGDSRTNIARLNADGGLDANFDPGTGVGGVGSSVTSLALQPDGKVLVGGIFALVNGISRRGIARLNRDGSLDNSFDPGTGANEVFAVALQPDGKVLVGGPFTTVNGVNRKFVARLNANGSLDTNFNPGDSVDGFRVNCMALQPDGRLLIGGGFASVNGLARNYVARLFGGDSAVLNFQKLNDELVLSWTNAGFNLQSAPALTGPFTNLPSATSPFTNPLTAPQQFFRLISN